MSLLDLLNQILPFVLGREHDLASKNCKLSCVPLWSTLVRFGDGWGERIKRFGPDCGIKRVEEESCIARLLSMVFLNNFSARLKNRSKLNSKYRLFPD